MNRALAAIAILLAAPLNPANAATIMASCVFTTSTDALTRYVQADEIVFDDGKQSLDMRIKHSDANWLFVTQKTEFIEDVFTVKFDKDGTVAAAGLRNSVPVAFRLDPDGTLDFTYITAAKPERIHFECMRHE